MDIILLERVSKLGQMGEVVSVKEGYARNYLLPQGKALRASESNIKRFEAEKAAREARNEETKAEARADSEKIDGGKFVVLRSASDGGALYGSVTTRDAAAAVSESGIPVNRKQVRLTYPIKELGLHTVTVHLHPEVEATVTLNVARTAEEAEIQARGKTVREASSDEDALEFEIAELFDDIDAAQLDELDGESRDAADGGGGDAPSTGDGPGAPETGTSADGNEPKAAESGRADGGDAPAEPDVKAAEGGEAP